MTLLRRLGCVGDLVCSFRVSDRDGRSNSVAGQDTDTPPLKKHASRVDPNSPDYQLRGNEHKGGGDRESLLASIKEKLDGADIKPPHSKKAEDDYFVLGTIDLQDKHATVDFLIKQGVQKTTDFIVEFVEGKAAGAIREWRVFARAKNMKAAEVLRLKAKATSIEDQLVAFKKNTAGKKSPDDYFVIGTADLNSITAHAHVRFEILVGIKAAADFLINFIFNRPKSHKGEWHVFYRAGTEAQATDYRQQMRDMYDPMEAQRSQMAAIYHAKTTARC